MTDSNILSYTIQGEGIPLIFLHGFCEDATMWDEVLNAGFEGYQTICIDLPGFGKSSINDSADIDKMAELVFDVLQANNIEKCFLFGHSMGGYVGLSLAEKYPQFLSGLGLIHSHPFADSQEGKNNREKAAKFVEKFGSELYIKQMVPNLFPKSFSNSNRFLLERLVFSASKYPAQGIINALNAMQRRVDKSEVLKNLKVPFLSIVGKKDELLPTEKLMSQFTMVDITQAEFLDKIGHMGPFENPKLINTIINSFLENSRD